MNPTYTHVIDADDDNMNKFRPVTCKLQLSIEISKNITKLFIKFYFRRCFISNTFPKCMHFMTYINVIEEVLIMLVMVLVKGYVMCGAEPWRLA